MLRRRKLRLRKANLFKDMQQIRGNARNQTLGVLPQSLCSSYQILLPKFNRALPLARCGNLGESLSESQPSYAKIGQLSFLFVKKCLLSLYEAPGSFLGEQVNKREGKADER